MVTLISLLVQTLFDHEDLKYCKEKISYLALKKVVLPYLTLKLEIYPI